MILTHFKKKFKKLTKLILLKDLEFVELNNIASQNAKTMMVKKQNTFYKQIEAKIPNKSGGVARDKRYTPPFFDDVDAL